MGEARSSAHGDETELESVRALCWVNTKEHKGQKPRTYRGSNRSKESKDPVAQQSKSMPLADDTALYAHSVCLIEVVYEILQVNLAGGRRIVCYRSFDGINVGI